MPDPVHLLIEVDPQFGVHRAVKRFKGASSRYVRLEFPELKSRLPSLWTNSYFRQRLETLAARELISLAAISSASVSKAYQSESWRDTSYHRSGY